MISRTPATLELIRRLVRIRLTRDEQALSRHVWVGVFGKGEEGVSGVREGEEGFSVGNLVEARRGGIWGGEGGRGKKRRAG